MVEKRSHTASAFPRKEHIPHGRLFTNLLTLGMLILAGSCHDNLRNIQGDTPVQSYLWQKDWLLYPIQVFSIKKKNPAAAAEDPAVTRQDIFTAISPAARIGISIVWRISLNLLQCM